MYRPRTLPELQREFLAALTAFNSPANDFSPGSVVYSLARANAAMLNEMELKLAETINQYSLATASGEQLTTFASALGIQRKGAERARGYALFSIDDGSVVIRPSQLLVNVETGIEYYTINTDPILVNSIVEVPIEIQAVEPGAASNVSGGTRLFLVPDEGDELAVSVVVGDSRRGDGSVCGEVSGGRDAEGDESLRNRVIDSISAKGGANHEFLRQRVLQSDLVLDAKVVTRVGGLVEIWVRSPVTLNEYQIKELYLLAKPFVPSGILHTVFQLKEFPLFFSIWVSPTYKDISSTLRSNIIRFLELLEFGEKLHLERLKSFLDIKNIRIISPSEDILPPIDSVFVLGDLYVTYDL